VVIEVGLYAAPSDVPRKIAEAWIPAWTELENVPVESSQQTALTFSYRALTGVVESHQQPTLHVSTPGSHCRSFGPLCRGRRDEEVFEIIPSHPRFSDGGYGEIRIATCRISPPGC
jgi:hypothetical protein